jgi:hydrogenase nickel incorporation protein HypA/HybF
MHEFSIASGLVEKLLEFSAQNPERTIIEVRLEIGELSHIDSEALSFCYEAITKVTPIQGSSLIIEKIPALVKCPYCSYRGRPNYWDDVLIAAPVITMRCPKCGETVEADQGQDCALKSVKFIEANAAQTL